MVSAASTSLVLNARSCVAWKIGSTENEVRFEFVGGELDYKERELPETRRSKT